jgi:hypothetical protein
LKEKQSQNTPVQMKEKSKHAGLAQQNSFGPAFFFQTLLLWLLNGTAKPNNLLEKSATNMISLLFPISHWSIIMIGSGGLLLVVSHLFAVSVLVLMGGC